MSHAVPLSDKCEIEVQDLEEGGCIVIEDDGQRFTGCSLYVWDMSGNRVAVDVSKSLMLNLANEIRKRINAQGYRAVRVREDGLDAMQDFKVIVKPAN